MNMKMKQIFCAAMALATISAIAATPASLTTDAKPMASASTNSKSGDIETKLFGDDVVAKGNGFQIKRSELNTFVTKFKSALIAQGRELPAERTLEAVALNQMIVERLLLGKATSADKATAVQRADLQLSNLLARAGSQDAMEKQFTLHGTTVADYRKEIIDLVTAQEALRRETGATVSDEEIKAYYTNNPADFEQPEQVHVAHILLSTKDVATGADLSADQKAAKLKQAQDVLKRARAGED